jgi:hypothetical protein
MRLFRIFVILVLILVLAGCSPIPTQDLPNFSEKADKYLISQFGEKLFNENIRKHEFVPNQTRDFYMWGGCNVYYLPKEEGNKFVFRYVFDQSDYVTLPSAEEFQKNPEVWQNYVSDLARLTLQEEPITDVNVVFNEDGELYCTAGVVDCRNNPSYCFPYEFNKYENVLEIFEEKCNRKFNDIRFKPYNNYGKGDIKPEESRFLWCITYSPCIHKSCNTVWAVYIDPQTGEPVEDHFFGPDSVIYFDEQGKKISSEREIIKNGNKYGELIPLKELGIDYRVCKKV